MNIKRTRVDELEGYFVMVVTINKKDLLLMKHWVTTARSFNNTLTYTCTTCLQNSMLFFLCVGSVDISQTRVSEDYERDRNCLNFVKESRLISNFL